MQRFEQYKDNNTIYLFKDKVTKKTCDKNNETILHTSSQDYKASCIKCNRPKCHYLQEKSLIISDLENFSFDKDIYNCPVDAITINKGYPSIDNEKCILCGLCVVNCPTGAIYYNKKTNKISVNTDITDVIYQVDSSKNNIEKQNHQIQQLAIFAQNNPFQGISEKMLKSIQDKLLKVDSEYHNKIVRNLLIGLGCKATYPRKGDIGNRMDGIFKTQDGYIGVLEVEFGTDSLSAARGLLDDIAMLQYKQKIDKASISPLAVLVSMPNNRQDYWNVIYDVKEITGVTIHTMTICSLMILLWNKTSIDLISNPYYADMKNPSIRESLEKNINKKIEIPYGYLGILEPEK